MSLATGINEIHQVLPYMHDINSIALFFTVIEIDTDIGPLLNLCKDIGFSVYIG